MPMPPTLLLQPIDYMPNAIFDEVFVDKLQSSPRGRAKGSELYDTIMGDMPDSDIAVRYVKPPEGLTPYLSAMYAIPVLTREQEAHLFRKMNCLLHLAERARIAAGGARGAFYEAMCASLLDRAVSVRSELVRRNLRLVISIAKKFAQPGEDLGGLISDGNISCFKAVAKFDFSRGFKFSTYATWAIRQNFARSIPVERRHHERFMNAEDGMLEGLTDRRMQESEVQDVIATGLDLKDWMRRELDDREFRIVCYRYGLFDVEQITLAEVGSLLGLTKERVRQIQMRALSKLRAVSPALAASL